MEFVLSDLHKATYAVEPEFARTIGGPFRRCLRPFIRMVQKLVTDPIERVAIVQQGAQYRTGAHEFLQTSSYRHCQMFTHLAVVGYMVFREGPRPEQAGHEVGRTAHLRLLVKEELEHL